MISIVDAKKRSNSWNFLLKKKKKKELLASFVESPMVEVAEFLSNKPKKIYVTTFALLDHETAAKLFGHFHEHIQLALYNALPRKSIGSIFEHMPSDLRADFYAHLNDDQQVKLLPYLSKEVCRDVIILSAYSPDEAGGIMSTDFVTLEQSMTAEEALEQIRKDAPSKEMMYVLYVVNENKKMIGTIQLKDLIMVGPNSKVLELIQDTFVFAKVKDDKEFVARKIEKYDLVALPILNDEGQLVGMVSYDDAIEVIRTEQTEDMERFMGIVSDEGAEDYLHTSSWEHFTRRITWVTGLFILSIFAALLLHYFEEQLSPTIMTLLALYLPMISDTGGNVGSQAATVVIRALSLGQIGLRSWRRILYKELKVSLMFASLLFFLAFIKVFFLQKLLATSVYGNIWVLAMAISLAVSMQVVSATLIGAGLPLFIKWLGKDPALAASPAITTIVDITGIFIYFSVAIAFIETSS